MNSQIKKINLNHSFIFFLFCNVFSVVVFKFTNLNISTLFCFLLILTIGVSHGALDHLKGKKLLTILHSTLARGPVDTVSRFARRPWRVGAVRCGGMVDSISKLGAVQTAIL